MNYDTTEIVCMLLGCSFINENDKIKANSIIDDVRNGVGIERLVWKIAPLLHLYEVLRPLRQNDNKRLYELRLKIRCNEMEIVANLINQIKEVLDRNFILPQILEKKLIGGPIIGRETSNNEVKLDLRSIPFLDVKKTITSLDNICNCIYFLTIGEWIYIGSTHNASQRLYWHHKKMSDQLFINVPCATYSGLESAVQEYGYTLHFKIIKKLEKGQSLIQEEQEFLNNHLTYPKMLNSSFVAYRSE